ncbi:unnamed protein product [Caenorhabditis angaria]|uniref:Degenerin mec-4/10 cytosolic domain-containing protein n=1 Tax=Caenorhabditis angaria TaxID=860376 RepID=A0A9P1J6L2_9PELO|nr:unnamed protein product [Caenorhabditis angaria]
MNHRQMFRYQQLPKARDRFQNEDDLKSLRSFKTDFSNYLASDTNFLNVAEIMTSYAYGESNNDNEKEIQCDLLTENGGMEIDPTRLSYHERIRYHLQQFCYKTSSHGIPMLGQAPNSLYRFAWLFLLTICAAQFVNQAYAVVKKYNKMDKITDIQLKFDSAPFPAITLCNLNPYKDSIIRSHDSISKILGVFKSMMKKAGDNSAEVQDDVEVGDITIQTGRFRRAADGTKFEPAYSNCNCNEENSKEECEHEDGEPKGEGSLCVCAYDRMSGDAWPCHQKHVWKNTTCVECDDHNFCSKKPTKKNTNKKGGRRTEKTNTKLPCLCVKAGPKDWCVGTKDITSYLNLWELGEIEEVFSDVTPEEREALGFGNMTDEVAIVTKAKENIIFAMSALSENQR